MNTHATAGHVTSFAWSRNTSRFPSIAGMIAPHVDLHDRSRSRWNMNHFRQTARGCLTTPVDLPAADAAMAIVLDGPHLCIWSWPVTMHDDQGPVEKEGRDGGSLKLLTWPLDVEGSILRFPSPLHASEGALRTLAKGNWKIEMFCGVVGLDGRCSAKAEQRKKPVAVGPLPGAYL